MTTTARLTIAPAPKFASAYAFTCCRCDHEELLHPVFLSDGRAYGTRCAAIMLGLVAETATTTEARRALKAAERAQADAEYQQRLARTAAEGAAWETFCATFGGIPATVQHFGGFAAARAAYRAKDGNR